MLGLIIIFLLIGCLLCGVLGYLIYKIWINQKRRRIIESDVIKNKNASTRRKQSKKKKSSNKSIKRRKPRSKKKKTSKRPKKKKRNKSTAKRSKSRKRKKSKSVKREPVVTINPIPQIIEPINTRIEAKHPNQGFNVIARRRMDNKKSPPYCMNSDDLYSNIFQIANNFDSVKNLLPCDENDMTNLSKYDCSDDKITFNVSISQDCHQPLKTHFTYHTDVHPKLHHYNTTITCSNCYINISIDPIREAWDYILTLQVPEPSNICPHQHVAHCGGHTSQLSWFILGGLSGLSILFGVLFCYVKHYRSQKPRITVKRKKAEVATLNA